VKDKKKMNELVGEESVSYSETGVAVDVAGPVSDPRGRKRKEGKEGKKRRGSKTRPTLSEIERDLLLPSWKRNEER